MISTWTKSKFPMGFESTTKMDDKIKEGESGKWTRILLGIRDLIQDTEK